MQNGIQAVLDFGAQGRFGLAELGPGGSSRSKMWTARVLTRSWAVLKVGQRSVNEVIRWDSDDDGLPFHALSALALVKDLASCQLQPCPFVQASAVLVQYGRTIQSGRMYVAYSRHFSHDLMTRLMIKKDPCSLSVVEARSYCAQMFAGIHYMHSRGILHRNLKPAHILFDQQGFLAISGFDCACREHVGQSPRDSCNLSVAPIVTPPERLLGEPHCDRSADIWAAGLIVAFMGKQGQHRAFFHRTGGETYSQIGLIFGIFERLGTPQSPHPLTLLPDFSHNFPQWSYKGWDDTKPILGAEGVDFLAGLTNLDPRLRTSAEAALLHTFLEDRPGSDEPKLPAHTYPVRRRPACAVAAEAGAAVASALQTATQLYSGLDFELERAFQIRRLVVAKAIRVFVRRGGHSDVCEHIWSFMFQPKLPEVMNLPKLQASGPGELPSPVRVRCLFMDCLTSTASEMKLGPQVLFLSARLVDQSVVSNTVKLSGINEYRALFVAALLVAVKMERQELAGSRGWLSHIARGDSVIIEQALKFEAEIMSSPAMVSGWGPYQFLCSFAEKISLSKVNFGLAHYMLDRSLLAFGLSRHTPSLLAAAACWLSISTYPQQDELEQPGGLAACCGRSEASLARVAEELREVADSRNFPECKAARQKHVATIRLLMARDNLAEHEQ